LEWEKDLWYEILAWVEDAVSKSVWSRRRI
jgi:hypothetical protein